MKLFKWRANSRKKARSSSRLAATLLTCNVLLAGTPAFAKTAIGVDLGYRSLTVLTDLENDAKLQVDVGSAWYWDGFEVGVDYIKIYPRKKSSATDPDVFYGFGGVLATASGQTLGIGIRAPFGVMWDIKDTPLQIGAAAVPVLVSAGSYSGIMLALSIPFRWRLD